MEAALHNSYHAAAEEEGLALKRGGPGFINLRAWPAVSTTIIMMIISQFLIHFQRWRSDKELLFFFVVLVVAWFRVGYPVLMWHWGVTNDRGYGWLEAWNQGIDFVSTAVLFFVATLSVNILSKEFSINGFTTVESVFMLLIIVVLFYGVYVYLIRLTEAKYYVVDDTNDDDEENQKDV